MKKQISDKVINRLTLYHCILSDYINKGEEYISSGQIASLLKIDDSQVRKDINVLNNSGKSRVGYIVKELKKSIETTLGFEKNKRAYIIGAGNLGMALANYGNFANYGLNIISLFDNDPNKMDKLTHTSIISNNTWIKCVESLLNTDIDFYFIIDFVTININLRISYFFLAFG